MIKGPGTVKGGNGFKYKTPDNKYYGAPGGMAVAFADSTWKPTAGNSKLTYGLAITGGALIRGGDGAEITGEEWIYNIENYGGDNASSPLSYDNPKFSLRAGNGAPAIGQTGAQVEDGKSDKAYAAITIDDGTVVGGSGGMINLNTSSMPVLTHYALMHNSVIKEFMNGVALKDKYSGYVSNQIKFLPGNGGDGIVIGDGRKYVYVAGTGTVEGGASGNFDYGQSKFVNQYSSIGAGNIAIAGNGISVYGDIGLTNVSPSDSTVTSANAASKTKGSSEMGIFIDGTVKGGSSPDAEAMNEYSGDGGIGIAIDGMYGRYDWGIIGVGSGGSVIGGSSGKTACGVVGASGDAIRELTPKGTEPFDTRFGSDYYIVNGNVKGGNGGNSMGLDQASAGANGMAFDSYRKGLRIFGAGIVSGGDYGSETDHDQSKRTDTADAIHLGPDASNVINVDQEEGEPVKINDVERISIKATMTHFNTNPTTSTQLSLSGIPEGYDGDVFIMWRATIYETSSEGRSTYDIESSGTDLSSFKLLSNASYGIYNQDDKLGYLAYPTYPGHSSIPLNMNNYTADVATTDRMSEDGKYQTDIFCRVVLADGRWGKSNVMRYEKNKGWDGTGDAPEDEDDQSGEEQDEMDAVLAVGEAIKALPTPEAVTIKDNADIVSAYDRFYELTDEQIDKYLFDYDYKAKLEACFAALAAIVDGEDQVNDEALISRIVETLNEIDDVDNLTLENDEASLKAAQAAYNNLSEDAKTEFDKTPNKTKLDNAVAKIDALRQAADEVGCRHTTKDRVAAKG